MKTLTFVRRTFYVVLATLVTIGTLAVQTPFAHADLPAPSWWNNTVCDTAHYTGAYSLGTTYNGVTACGPRPIGDGGADLTVNFFRGAWGENEWECVELVMRYMYLAYGVNPYNAPGGKDVVGNYSGTRLSKVNNDGSSLPAPGDILSESATANNAYGHTAVITSVSVTNGTGSVSVMEQNNSSTGANTIAVSGGILQSNVSGWLHNPTGSSSGHLQQFYVSGSSWVAADVSAQSHVNIAGDPYEDSSGGIWARDTNNHLRQFYVSGSSWVAADATAQSGVSISSDVSNGSSGIFAVDTNRHLRQFYVSGGSWVAADITAQSGVSVSGNPYEDSNGGLWARDTNSHLRQFYVSGNSWVAADISGATGVNILSDPSSGSQGVIAADTNHHLRQFYVNNGWKAADITAQSGVSVAGNPFQDSSGGIWSRDANSHLRQFYVSGSSWVAADITAQSGASISSNPNNGSNGLFARDTNNHLRQFYVSGNSWVAADVTAQSGITTTGNPVQGTGGIFSNT